MRKVKKPKFDWEEFGEALDYFVMRFASRDATISKSGKFITIGVGDAHGPEFVVTREPDGWLVDRGGKHVEIRSYEQAAIVIEKEMGWRHGDEEAKEVF